MGKMKSSIKQIIIITTAISIILILLVIYICFFSTLSDYFFYTSTGVNPKGEFLKLTFQVIGGVAILLGAWHTYRTANAMYENNRLG